MLLRQLFNHPTFTYTYLLADPLSSDAILIDPVKEKLRDYVQLFNELGYTLKAAVDTHYHDDYVTGLPALRELWGCETIAGAPCDMPGITNLVEDGDVIRVGAMQINVIHTPGHTDDSYCYLIEQPGKSAVFTGDTLLVRTVGLSDQATSDPRMHYDSLINVLCKLDDATIVYPGKDFKGWPMSTIGEEKEFNPYLNCADINEFVEKKRTQKAADIRPVEKFSDDDEEIELILPGQPAEAAAVELNEDAEEIELTAVAADSEETSSSAGDDFFLPDEEPAPLAVEPAPAAPASEPAAQVSAEPLPSKGDGGGGNDPGSMPSWR